MPVKEYAGTLIHLADETEQLAAEVMAVNQFTAQQRQLLSTLRKTIFTYRPNDESSSHYALWSDLSSAASFMLTLDTLYNDAARGQTNQISINDAKTEITKRLAAFRATAAKLGK
jgi:hypothetical protein